MDIHPYTHIVHPSTSIVLSVTVLSTYIYIYIYISETIVDIEIEVPNEQNFAR